MKRKVVPLLSLLAMCAALGVHSQEPTRRLVIEPGLLEVAAGGSSLSVGFGIVESTGDRNQLWSLFPIRLALRSGSERFALSLSGLDLLARRGVSFGRPLTITGVHRGDVVSIGGTVTVAGVVEGSVWVFGADLVLRSLSRVDGDAVALGGKVRAERGAVVGGNKQALPAVHIPFLGFITSRQSAEALQLVLELFAIGFTLLALFLVLHFRASYLRRQVEVVAQGWGTNIVYLFAGLVLAPVVVAFLAASVVGLVFVPVIVLALLVTTYLGFLGVLVRLGQIFVRGGEEGLRVFGAGLLGLAIVRGPALVGRVLSVLASETMGAVGSFFKGVGGLALFLALLYGFGCGLAAAREAGR